MPSLTFVLPHWLYWAGLIVFPLVAMYVVRRQRASAPSVISLPISYLLWICGGFVGLHRFYLRNFWGVIYIPLFLVILYGNVQSRDARNGVSAARNDLLAAEFMVERAEKDVTAGRTGAASRLDAAKADVAAAAGQLDRARSDFAHWQRITLGVAILIAAMLLLDAGLLPGLVRKSRDKEDTGAGVASNTGSNSRREANAVRTGSDPTVGVHIPATRPVDRISGFVGEFVAYWSLIAVFVYYFEVIARYVFNSPTNWAHESMFLMFGMQYLLSGAYALRDDAHVRVDVIYMHLSLRAKVVTDIITSVFFFIFATTLLVTGIIFSLDAIDVMEVSFTEWAIQYWPVKVTIALGALLILLQGIVRLIKDVVLLRRPIPEVPGGH